ncbi:molybdate ABC transporter substrate-binding protein [Geodermatophilus sabuli]|nr:molybdate ABC transporter substrate-binding protein [Geodermatophilus sabuli]MBB3086944.1 molybdate transport system substrate-binding protein [Geodermatophilus sabuli]
MRRTSLLLTAALVLAGCGGTANGGSNQGAGAGGTLTVFAAASLTDVFDSLGGRFRQEHPGVDLRISYGGSSSLAAAIVQGAPVDVFASANAAQMDVVAGEGLAGEPAVFAANVLEIAVPPGNPAGITGLADFAREELTLAVCAPEVPCGAAAEEVFAAAGVAARPDTQEEDVRSALLKAELGEVDAALVYASDVDSRGTLVEGIAFPEAERAVNDYPICTLADAPNPGAAQAFVDLVLSEEGQRVLADAGFRTP